MNLYMYTYIDVYRQIEENKEENNFKKFRILW